MAIKAKLISGAAAEELISKAEASLQVRSILTAIGERFKISSRRFHKHARQVLYLTDQKEELSGYRVHLEYELLNREEPVRFRLLVQTFVADNAQETIGYVVFNNRYVMEKFYTDDILLDYREYIKEVWNGTVVLQEREFEPEVLIHELR